MKVEEQSSIERGHGKYQSLSSRQSFASWEDCQWFWNDSPLSVRDWVLLRLQPLLRMLGQKSSCFIQVQWFWVESGNSQILLDLEVNSKVQQRQLTIPAAKKIKVSKGQKNVIILFLFFTWNLPGWSISS